MQAQCPDWRFAGSKVRAVLGSLALVVAAPASAQVDGPGASPPISLAPEPDVPAPSPSRSLGPPTIWNVDLLCGLSLALGGWGASVDLGLRIDRVRARYHGSVHFTDDSDFTSSGLRADWIFADDRERGLAGFVGGGVGTLKQQVSDGPVSHGAVAALEVGMIVGTSWRLTPLVVGIEALFPLAGVTDSTPTLALTLSFDPFYWFYARALR